MGSHSLLQGIFPTVSYSPALAGGFFTTASPGKTYHPIPARQLLLPALLSTSLLQSLWTCFFWTFCIKGIIQYVTFYVWPPSLSVMFFRLIYVAAFLKTSFLSVTGSYCSVWRDHGLLTRSSTGGHSGCFHLLTVWL